MKTALDIQTGIGPEHHPAGLSRNRFAPTIVELIRPSMEDAPPVTLAMMFRISGIR
jgi:hypothetical protein